MPIIRKISAFLLKTIVSLVLIAVFAVLATSVSPIYRFSEPAPFSGPDVFDPYRNIDSVLTLLYVYGN